MVESMPPLNKTPTLAWPSLTLLSRKKASSVSVSNRYRSLRTTLGVHLGRGASHSYPGGKSNHPQLAQAVLAFDLAIQLGEYLQVVGDRN